MQEIGGLELNLEQLKKIRLQEVMRTNDQLRRKITGIHRELDVNRAEVEELRQAHIAGDNCVSAIGEVIIHLKDAEHWATGI